MEKEDDITKTCSKCGVEKPFSDFHKLSSKKDGHRPDCKECAKKQRKKRYIDNPVDTAIYNMVSNMFKRIVWHADRKKNQSYKNKGIRCLLGTTPEEVRGVIKKHFESDVEQLLLQGKTPSIDRINSDGHYEISNIRIINALENALEGARKGTQKTSKAIEAWFPPTRGFQTFASVSEASRHYGIKRDTVLASIKNNRPTKKGVQFRYACPIR